MSRKSVHNRDIQTLRAPRRGLTPSEERNLRNIYTRLSELTLEVERLTERIEEIENT